MVTLVLTFDDYVEVGELPVDVAQAYLLTIPHDFPDVRRAKIEYGNVFDEWGY